LTLLCPILRRRIRMRRRVKKMMLRKIVRMTTMSRDGK